MMNMGARSIITGHQIIGQCAGSISTINRISTHVGPNALLRSPSYPVPFSTPPGPDQGMNGPLFVPAAPPPPGSDAWRVDPGGTENAGYANGLCTQWPGGTSQAYVYNNDPSNTGGIVPDGGLMIDGFPVPAGTLVFQFMDLSYGSIGLTLLGGADVVFRGCRGRSNWSDVGFCNNEGDIAQRMWFLYCDIGGMGLDYTSTLAAVCFESYGTGLVWYRCYLSYMDSGIFPKASESWIDVFENYIEKITAYPGKHLNGISLNGQETNCRIQRNSIVIARYDENGVQIEDTDCISFFDDVGSSPFFPGTGTNPDGTPGYQIVGNYMGGTGYCAYPAASDGATNANWANNLITTSSYPVGDTSGGASGVGGGYFGPVYPDQPAWGMDGNTKSNNLWADGPDHGETWV